MARRWVHSTRQRQGAGFLLTRLSNYFYALVLASSLSISTRKSFVRGFSLLYPHNGPLRAVLARLFPIYLLHAVRLGSACAEDAPYGHGFLSATVLFRNCTGDSFLSHLLESTELPRISLPTLKEPSGERRTTA